MSSRCPYLANRVLVFVLALLVFACERSDSRLSPIQRLNEVPGDVAPGFLPDYTALSARGSDVAVAWMSAAGAEPRAIVLRLSEDAGQTWGPEFRPGSAAFSRADATDPQLLRFAGTEDFLILWDVATEPRRRKAIAAQASPDQGQTFLPPQILSEASRVFDPVALTLEDRNGLSVWVSQEGRSRQLMFRVSKDAGRTWGTNAQRLDPTAVGLARQPSLLVLPDEKVLAVWEQRAQQNRGGVSRPHLRASVGEDHGRQWSPSVPVDARFEGPSPLWPRVVYGDDRVSLIWSTAITGATHRGAVVLSQSLDEGQSWSAPQELFVGEEAPSTNLLAAGKHVYLSWHGGPRHDIGIYFLASANGGANWLAGKANPLRIDDPQAEGNALRPAMAADDEGRIAVAWTVGRQRLWMRHSGDYGKSWSDVLLLAAEEGAGKLKYPQIAITEGQALVTWERWPDKSLHIKSIGDMEKRLPLDFFFRRIDLS